MHPVTRSLFASAAIVDLADARTLELAGIHEDDAIHWTELFYSDPANPAACGGASTLQGSYRAAELVRPGLIACVHDGGID